MYPSVTAATSSGESAGMASDTDAALVSERATTPAARRTATASTSFAAPSPTTTGSGELITPAVGIFATSPALPEKPRLCRSGRNLRPQASLTSSPPAAAINPLGVVATPMITASARVLAGLAGGGVSLVTRALEVG